MTTTLAKAKAIQGEVDKVVTLAKKEGLSKEREIAAKLSAGRVQVEKITSEVAATFKDRAGGFTRIIRLPVRKGDAAEMARIEWVQQITVKETPKVKKNKDLKASPKSKKGVTPPKKRQVKKTK